MAKYLVASNSHSLLPFAHRLRLEGHDVEVLVWRKRFERAWDGKVHKILRSSRGEINPENLQPVFKAARDGQLTVLTDVAKLTEWFSGSPHLFGLGEGTTPKSAIRLGFWFNGERWQAPHLLVYDMGVWPGGLGPAQPGGITLVRIDKLDNLVTDFLNRAAVQLRPTGFRGLANVGLTETPDGPELEGLEAGWPFLHTHAFMAELEQFGKVLDGEPPTLEKRFVTALPVSIPPWPNQKTPARRDLAVEGLTPQQAGRVFWHDVQVDAERRRLHTAGLDGLVGVARGSAQTSSLSQGRALEVASKLALPEKQFRPEVGQQVPAVLAALEEAYGIVLQ